MIGKYGSPKYLALASAAFAVALVGAMSTLTAGTDEASFMAENEAAMAKMMSAMNVKPSGDVDRDFVAMMVPHHQGAIDMARAQLRYGRNEQLRRLAQEIIVTQQQEIAVMQLALGDRSLDQRPSGAQPVSDHMSHMHQEH